MSSTPRTDAMELEIQLGQSARYRMNYLARELERENAALQVLVKELERKLAAEAEYAAETHARHQGLVEQVEHLIGIIQQLESDLARFGTIEAFEQKKEAQP